MNLRILLIGVTIVLYTNTCLCQDLKSIERDLCTKYMDAYYHGNLPDEEQKKADSILHTALLKYTLEFPSTLTYPFDSLKLLNSLPEGGIYSSSDSNFRIYSTKNDNVIQYRKGNKVYSILLRPINKGTGKNFNFREVYMVKSKAKTWYIGIYETDEGEGVKFFTIDKKGLNDTIKLIKTPSGLHNELTYTAYDYQNNPNRFIYYDATTLTLYIPLVNSSFLFTNKTIMYRFTGMYFEKTEQ